MLNVVEESDAVQVRVGIYVEALADVKRSYKSSGAHPCTRSMADEMHMEAHHLWRN